MKSGGGRVCWYRHFNIVGLAGCGTFGGVRVGGFRILAAVAGSSRAIAGSRRRRRRFASAAAGAGHHGGVSLPGVVQEANYRRVGVHFVVDGKQACLLLISTLSFRAVSTPATISAVTKAIPPATQK